MRCNTFVMAALALTFASVATGEDKAGPAKGKAADQAALQQKLLQQFDANKDGVLSEQEKFMAAEMMRRTGMPALGIEPGGFPGAEQFNKQFDKDGDGKLNDAEKLAAQAAYQRLRGRSRGTQYGPGFGFAQGIANAGGAVAANPAGPGAAGGEAKSKVPALVKRFDKDGDGKLNDEEKATAQAELKKSKKDKAKAEVEADKP
jgi:hypothetical protein